jgi:hypothetical protein
MQRKTSLISARVPAPDDMFATPPRESRRGAFFSLPVARNGNGDVVADHTSRPGAGTTQPRPDTRILSPRARERCAVTSRLGWRGKSGCVAVTAKPRPQLYIEGRPRLPSMLSRSDALLPVRAIPTRRRRPRCSESIGQRNKSVARLHWKSRPVQWKIGAGFSCGGNNNLLAMRRPAAVVLLRRPKRSRSEHRAVPVLHYAD